MVPLKSGSALYVPDLLSPIFFRVIVCIFFFSIIGWIVACLEILYILGIEIIRYSRKCNKLQYVMDVMFFSPTINVILFEGNSDEMHYILLVHRMMVKILENPCSKY